jgi:hypothetical protein
MAFWCGTHLVNWRGLDAPSVPQLNTMERLDMMSLLLAEFSDVRPLCGTDQPTTMTPRQPHYVAARYNNHGAPTQGHELAFLHQLSHPQHQDCALRAQGGHLLH